ncbi:uncharacterized protein TRIADDRAFT_58948 [Trichoplax adhaerens]|uniref:AB hydrolase-1 domain-containing protein n=1 Tax=Trichoplax adhaerens TaxID=10228 RepID=B3S444_TRIAD|nr:hypothetical protein TRIADDRAFT_58948 [Trichoplax adhaerens]EDV22574.1 hypothetical protein TRIADDRAFT_58948 [Trichoplax adhaerens]|eukprot:XP_002115118.1 hypothetical protein TRIADDRAFT_58948 [Trichoplax adhaerens]
MVTNSLPCILTWKSILLISFGLSTSYYFYSIVKKPLIIISNGKLKDFIHNHIDTLKRPYYPTPWALNGHLQTVFRAVLEKSPELGCHREIIVTTAGIQLAIDWLIDDQSDDDHDKPIVLYVPGIGGKARSNCLVEARSLGYRTAIFCIRGSDGLPLAKPSQLPRLGDWTDLATIIDHIHQKYPRSMINVIGISLGGMIICNYLAETEPSQNYVHAACIVSTPFDMKVTQLSLETWFNTRMYNVYIAEFMINYLKCYSFHSHESSFTENGHSLPFNFEDVKKCITFSQFDQSVILPLFGYPDLTTYYKLASPGIRMDKIKTPLVCINAIDDPFSPIAGIPIDKFNQSPDIALILTRYGGHVGFIEKLWPTKTTYADKETNKPPNYDYILEKTMKL